MIILLTQLNNPFLLFLRRLLEFCRAATKVSLPTLINIANALEVSLDELVCGSLVRSEHIAVRQLNELLSDCTPDELQAVIEMVKVTKRILRR